MSVLFLIIVFVLAVYVIMIYNSLVTVKNNIDKSWANIDILLKQRHDELPKLVDTCKQYMQHEQETLEKVIQARARVSEASASHDVAALGTAENTLRLGLGNLFAVAENYPELKANQNFAHLQTRITDLENAIADRREFYNDSVYINNVRVQEFPELLIAKAFNFPEAEMLQFAAAELKDVDIQARFKS